MTTTTGVVEEGDLPTENKPESEKIGIAKLLFAFTGLFERWKNEYETRRHPPDRGPDPDYASGINDLENIRKVIQEELGGYEPNIRINNSKGPGSSWQNKVLVGVAITVISAVILGGITTYAIVGSIRTRIEDYISSNDRRMDSMETRLRDNERRLDRGAGVP